MLISAAKGTRIFDAYTKEELTLLEFTRRLLGEEVGARNSKSLQRRMKQARFPEYKTVDEFDFGFQQSISKHQILHYA